jgi:predicted metalloprotease with PDZ domain
MLWRDSHDTTVDATMHGLIDEATVARALRTVGGPGMTRELKALIHGTDDAPWEALLAKLGVAAKRLPAKTLADAWGLRVSEGAAGVTVKHVLQGGAARAAGLAPGDELIAVDGWRLRKLEDALGWCRIDQPVSLTTARRQQLRTVRLDPTQGVVSPMVSLSLAEGADASTRRRRQAWLEGR